MINHHASLVFVWNVADFEARNLGAKSIEPVHLFLGILKSVDFDILRLKEIQILSPGILAEVQNDLSDVRLAFKNAGIETTPIRRRIRKTSGKSGQDNKVRLRRSSRSRAVFAATEAFVKSGSVKPIHLLSILAEMNIPRIAQAFQDSCLDMQLLLHISTMKALSVMTRLDGQSDNEGTWANVSVRLRQEGWKIGWSRLFTGNTITWKIDASKGKVQHIVQTDDFLSAILKLESEVA